MISGASSLTRNALFASISIAPFCFYNITRSCCTTWCNTGFPLRSLSRVIPFSLSFSSNTFIFLNSFLQTYPLNSKNPPNTKTSRWCQVPFDPLVFLVDRLLHFLLIDRLLLAIVHRFVFRTVDAKHAKVWL